MWRRSALSAAALLGACGEPDSAPPAPSAAHPPPRSTAVEPASPPLTSPVSPAPPRRCATPRGIDGSPTSIADAVALINALPPPVTVPCFVESLARPLHVFASASPFSAQPSKEVTSPRIFIRNGPLTMTVAPQGIGAHLLEFGEHAEYGRTLKGELELPPTATLTASAPTEHIRAGAGSTCGTCHDDEVVPTDTTRGFISEVLHPSPEFDVSLDRLREETEHCDDSRDAERCALLHALFDHGEVRAGVLPADGRICDH